MSSDRARWFAVACVAAASTLLVDQATKAMALTWLSQDERIPLIGDLFGLTLAFNPGAILSLGSQSTAVVTVFAAVATVLLVVAATRARSPKWAVGLGIILGGALGNLADRLFAPPGFGIGHVTDFLAYGNLFVGNLADVALGVGAVILCIAAIEQHRARSRTRPQETDEPVGAAGTVDP